jgi:hypothetical protein
MKIILKPIIEKCASPKEMRARVGVNGKMRKNKQIGACPFVGKAEPPTGWLKCPLDIYPIVLAFLQSGSKHLSLAHTIV